MKFTCFAAALLTVVLEHHRVAAVRLQSYDQLVDQDSFSLSGHSQTDTSSEIEEKHFSRDVQTRYLEILDPSRLSVCPPPKQEAPPAPKPKPVPAAPLPKPGPDFKSPAAKASTSPPSPSKPAEDSKKDGKSSDDTSAKKDDGSAKKDDGSAKKDDGSAKKDDGSAKKDDGSAKKDDGSAKKDGAGDAEDEEKKKTAEDCKLTKIDPADLEFKVGEAHVKELDKALQEAKAKYELQKEIETLKNAIFETRSTAQAQKQEMKEEKEKEKECDVAGQLKKSVAQMEERVADYRLAAEAEDKARWNRIKMIAEYKIDVIVAQLIKDTQPRQDLKALDLAKEYTEAFFCSAKLKEEDEQKKQTLESIFNLMVIEARSAVKQCSEPIKHEEFQDAIKGAKKVANEMFTQAANSKEE